MKKDFIVEKSQIMDYIVICYEIMDYPGIFYCDLWILLQIWHSYRWYCNLPLLIFYVYLLLPVDKYVYSFSNSRCTPGSCTPVQYSPPLYGTSVLVQIVGFWCFCSTSIPLWSEHHAGWRHRFAKLVNWWKDKFCLDKKHRCEQDTLDAFTIIYDIGVCKSRVIH